MKCSECRWWGEPYRRYDAQDDRHACDRVPLTQDLEDDGRQARFSLTSYSVLITKGDFGCSEFESKE